MQATLPIPATLPTRPTLRAAVNVLISAAANFESAAIALDNATPETQLQAARNADALIQAAYDRLDSFHAGWANMATIFDATATPTPPATVTPAPTVTPPTVIEPPVRATATVAQKTEDTTVTAPLKGLALLHALKAECRTAGLSVSNKDSVATCQAKLAKHRAAPPKVAAGSGKRAAVKPTAPKAEPPAPPKATPPVNVAPPTQPDNGPPPAPKAPRSGERADRLSAKLGVDKGKLLRALAELGLKLTDAE